MSNSNKDEQEDEILSEVPGEEREPTVNAASKRKRKLVIWKNVILISISFSVTFMAFQSLQALQSSINATGGIGVISLSVTYTIAILTNILFTSLIISKKGCKWSLVTSTFLYIGFAAAHLYPTWYTLIPGAVLVGIAAGPLWAAKCTYLTSSAIEYSKIIGKNQDPVVTHFFGVFYAIFQTGAILGSVLMSVILKPGSKPSFATNSTTRMIKHCGAVDCPSQTVQKFTNGTAENVADQQSVIILMSIFSGAIFLSGIFILVFVDDIKTEKDDEKIAIKSRISAVLRMSFKDKRMLFLLPIQMYASLLPGFAAVDFSKSYVTCSLGIDSLGFVMIGATAAQVAFSAFIGKIERCTGRKAIMITTYAITIALFVFLLKWDAEKYPQYVLYIFACIFGLVRCIWRTETNSYAGVLFPDDLKTAYSVVRTCTSLGFLISFAWGYHLCVYIKIYIHIAFLTLAMIGYFVTEYLENKRIKKGRTEEEVEMAEIES